MRVLIAGSNRARERLRAQLGELAGVIEIAGEFATADEAGASGLDADAIVLASPGPPGRPRRRDPGEGPFEEPLTARELEVLGLLAEGLPNKGIAARLGISDQTVKFHLAAIMGKLGAANRVETVRQAVRRGLISL
jgi:DNA-binding CsgD family transcriptional regulator